MNTFDFSTTPVPVLIKHVNSHGGKGILQIVEEYGPRTEDNAEAIDLKVTEVMLAAGKPVENPGEVYESVVQALHYSKKSANVIAAFVGATTKLKEAGYEPPAPPAAPEKPAKAGKAPKEPKEPRVAKEKKEKAPSHSLATMTGFCDVEDVRTTTTDAVAGDMVEYQKKLKEYSAEEIEAATRKENRVILAPGRAQLLRDPAEENKDGVWARLQHVDTNGEPDGKMFYKRPYQIRKVEHTWPNGYTPIGLRKAAVKEPAPVAEPAAAE